MPLASFMAIFRVLDTPEFSLSMVWNLRSLSSYSLQIARLPSVLPSFISKTSISVNVCAATLSRQRRRYRSALYTGMINVTNGIVFPLLPLKMCLNILNHIEKLKSSRILLTASPCMLLWLQVTHYSQVLVHSTVVNSRNSLRYILTFAFIMQFCKL